MLKLINESFIHWRLSFISITQLSSLYYTDTLYRYLVQIPCTDTLYRYLVQIPCTDTLYRYLVQIPCTDTLYRYLVQIPCTDTLYRYLVQIPCTDTLYRYLVQIPCTDTLYRYLVQIPCTDTLYGYLVQIPCTDTLYGYLVRIPCTDTLYRYLNNKEILDRGPIILITRQANNQSLNSAQNQGDQESSIRQQRLLRPVSPSTKLLTQGGAKNWSFLPGTCWSFGYRSNQSCVFLISRPSLQEPTTAAK